MNLIKTLTAALLLSVIFTACGGGDKKEEQKTDEKPQEETAVSADDGPATKLDGAWEIKRAEGNMAEMNVGTVYEFNGSKLAFGKGDFKNPGSTIVTDTTFSFQATGNEYVFMYNYKFNGDTLVVEMQKSGGQIFHLVKK